MNSGTLGFTSSQRMIFSVTPCCKAARQRWEGRDIALKEMVSYLHRVSMCLNPYWHTNELCFLKYYIVLSSGLPGVLPSATNKGLKIGFKTSCGPRGGESSLNTRMVFWSVARYAGGGCTELRQRQRALGRYPAARTEALQLPLHQLWVRPSRVWQSNRFGEEEGGIPSGKRFAVSQPRLSLWLFLGGLLASLPSAPNRKYGRSLMEEPLVQVGIKQTVWIIDR